jgi:hypothetical protein
VSAELMRLPRVRVPLRDSKTEVLASAVLDADRRFAHRKRHDQLRASTAL